MSCYTTRWWPQGGYFAPVSLGFPNRKVRFDMQSYPMISILNMLAATAVFATAILIIPKPRSFPNLHWEGLVRRDASTISKCS